MRHGWAALLIGLGMGAPSAAQVAVDPPSTNDRIVRPGVPDTWIPERREPDSVTAAVPDPRLQEPPPNVRSIFPGSPAPVGPVCAPKGALQSPAHDAAFTRALLLIYDENVPAAIEALKASLEVAGNKTEMTLSWQVLGDLYVTQGMTAEVALARKMVADLGCTPG